MGTLRVNRDYLPGEFVRLATVRVQHSDLYGCVAVGKVASRHRYAVAYRRIGVMRWRAHTQGRTSAEAMEQLAQLREYASSEQLHLSVAARSQVALALDGA